VNKYSYFSLFQATGIRQAQMADIPNNLTGKPWRVLILAEKSRKYRLFKIEKYLIHKK
jgi:hypothetical protein